MRLEEVMERSPHLLRLLSWLFYVASFGWIDATLFHYISPIWIISRPSSQRWKKMTYVYRRSESLDLCVPLLCVSGGHVASGSRFRTIEDPAGDRRLDARGSGSAAETRGDWEPTQCNATHRVQELIVMNSNVIVLKPRVPELLW